MDVDNGNGTTNGNASADDSNDPRLALRVRAWLLDADSARLPQGVVPFRRWRSVQARAAITTIATTYDARDFHEQPWRTLTEDERWWINAHTYSRLITAAENDAGITEAQAQQRRCCRPPGYTFLQKKHWRYCHQRTCLFCHARKVGAAARALWLARKQAPDGFVPRLGSFRFTGKARAWQFRLQRLRPAAASAFRAPVRGGYSYRAVVVLGPYSRPEVVTGLSELRAITGYCTVSRACAYAMRMPRSWRSTRCWARVEAYTHQARLWEHYGRARGPDVSGWLDY